MSVRLTSVGSATLMALGAAAQFASAATCPSTTFCRSDTVTNTGTLTSPNATVTPTGYPDNGPVSTAISYSLGDAFGPGQTTLGAHFSTTQTIQSAPGTTTPDSGWNFYDDFRFSINPGSTLDTAIISLNAPSGAGIGNLEVRLFSTAGGQNAAPTLGAPVGGTIVDKWSQPFPGGSFAYTLPTGFAAGSYDLQVRGLAASGSSYGGNINFTPVPLPAAFPLLLSGFGLVGGLTRRRKPVLAAN
jgi:hypothetical protein